MPLVHLVGREDKWAIKFDVKESPMRIRIKQRKTRGDAHFQ